MSQPETVSLSHFIDKGKVIFSSLVGSYDGWYDLCLNFNDKSFEFRHGECQQVFCSYYGNFTFTDDELILHYLENRKFYITEDENIDIKVHLKYRIYRVTEQHIIFNDAAESKYTLMISRCIKPYADITDNDLSVTYDIENVADLFSVKQRHGIFYTEFDKSQTKNSIKRIIYLANYTRFYWDIEQEVEYALEENVEFDHIFAKIPDFPLSYELLTNLSELKNHLKSFYEDTHLTDLMIAAIVQINMSDNVYVLYNSHGTTLLANDGDDPDILWMVNGDPIKLIDIDDDSYTIQTAGIKLDEFFGVKGPKDMEHPAMIELMDYLKNDPLIKCASKI